MKPNPLATILGHALADSKERVRGFSNEIKATKSAMLQKEGEGVGPVARQRAQFLLTGKDKAAIMAIKHALEATTGRSVSENAAVQVALRSVKKDAKMLMSALNEVISEDGRRK